jgi:hypothetical protein
VLQKRQNMGVVSGEGEGGGGGRRGAQGHQATDILEGRAGIGEVMAFIAPGTFRDKRVPGSGSLLCHHPGALLVATSQQPLLLLVPDPALRVCNHACCCLTCNRSH